MFINRHNQTLYSRFPRDHTDSSMRSSAPTVLRRCIGQRPLDAANYQLICSSMRLPIPHDVHASKPNFAPCHNASFDGFAKQFLNIYIGPIVEMIRAQKNQLLIGSSTRWFRRQPVCHCILQASSASKIASLDLDIATLSWMSIQIQILK